MSNGFLTELEKIKKQQSEEKKSTSNNNTTASAFSQKSRSSTSKGNKSTQKFFQELEMLEKQNSSKVSDDKKIDFFQKSAAFDDGYQAGDVTKAILGTVGDAAVGAVKGVARVGEGIGDLLTYGVAGASELLGYDEYADKLRKTASDTSVVDKVFGSVDNFLDKYSVLGRTSDSITEGIGQVGAMVGTAALGGLAGLGTVGSTILTTGVMGASGVGSGMSEAYQNNAAKEEARIYGLIAGGADALSELIFGGLGKGVKAVGISKGLSSADDMLAKWLTQKITNTIAKNAVQWGIKAGAEGVEEIIAGGLQAVGKSITYQSEKELIDILKDENLLEQFIVGSFTSGIAQAPGMVSADIKGKDFISGNTKNEQSVLDKVIADEIERREKEGSNLSNREKNKIAEEMQEKLEKGLISTDVIEEVLGGDSYTDYVKFVENEDKQREEYEELGKKKDPTLAEKTRYNEMHAKASEFTDDTKRTEMKKKLSDSVRKGVQNDKLINSYIERDKRGEKFTADIDKINNENAKQTVQNLIDSDIANNTTETHEFADTLVKYATDQNVVFEFTNNKKLKADGISYKSEKQFEADGSTSEYELGVKNIDDDFAPIVTVNGKTVSNYNVDYKNGKITFDGTAPKGTVTVKFRKTGLINGYKNGNKITINLESPKAWQFIVGHEITHALEGAKAEYNELSEAIRNYTKNNDSLQNHRKALESIYNKGTDIKTELNADVVGEYIMNDADFIKHLSVNHRNLFQRIYDRIKYLAKLVTAGSKEARDLERVKHAFENAYRAAATSNKAVSVDTQTKTDISDKQYSLSELDGTPIDEERYTTKEYDNQYSLSHNDEIAQGQSKYIIDNSLKSHVSVEELERAQEVTKAMVDVMIKYSEILPEDKIGKVLTNNGSYDKSVENTTICLRTLAYNEFVDKVQEEIGRPLTQMESFLVSQKLYDIATEPQCLYCYVSLDRKSFNEMLLRYMQSRDTVIDKYNKSDKLPDTVDELYREFLNGRKDTKNMKDRFYKWIGYADNGTRLLSLADISTNDNQRSIMAAEGTNAESLKEQLQDARAYAQSASWAKVQKDYVAYRDEILKLSDRVVKNLNEHYGLRWYSFSDYSAAFIVENMQQITDAAIRGLKGLSYTKDTDFAEIFAPSGMNINISVFVKKNDNGDYIIDERQSADLEKALKLRSEYQNVGIVATVTDDDALRWAGRQEWTDVIIPFHIVRTGMDVAEYYKWLNYTSESGDQVKDSNLWEAYVDSLNPKNENARKKVSKNIYPSEHHNDKDTYLALCESRGLTPRFARYAGEDWYMKLVNETRLSSDDTVPLKPYYNLDAAKASFRKFVDKGGYDSGWYKEGVDVEAEVHAVAEDVLSGRKANEVNYGRQDLNSEAILANRRNVRSHGQHSLNAEDGYGMRGTAARELMYEGEDIAPPVPESQTQPGVKLAEVTIPETPTENAAAEEDITPPVPGESTAETVAEIEDVSESESEALTEPEAERPIKTTLDKLSEKLGNVEYNIEVNKQNQAAQKAKFDEKISALQTLYNGSKNKNTKKANNILRSIEALTRQSKDVDADYQKSIRDLEKRAEKLQSQMKLDYTNKDKLEREYAAIDKENEKKKADLSAEFEQRRQELTELTKDRTVYAHKKALELYNEARTIKKGVKASTELSYLLDVSETLNSTKEAMWNSVRAALINISNFPDRAYVNGEPSVEAAARELLDINFKDLKNELSDLDNEHNRRLAELEEAAAKQRAEKRAEIGRVTRKKLHKQIIDGIKKIYDDLGYDFDIILDRAKDLWTVSTVDNTPARVMKKALGFKEGGLLADMTVYKTAQNETEGIRWLNYYTDRKNGLIARISKQYRIKPGSKESAAAMMYAEGYYVDKHGDYVRYGDDELAKDFPDMSVQNRIKGLAGDNRIRQTYDETLEAINDARVRNGYEPIPKRENYYMHFMEMDDAFSRLGIPFNPKDITSKDLPTDLNGMTADLKPGKPYFASEHRRTGNRTTYDLLGGLEKYLTAAKDQIYHIDDIQTLRALRNYVAEMYGRTQGLTGLDYMDEEEAQERIKQSFNNHLSTFAKFLNEQANVIAGKTALIDRGFEGMFGRRPLEFMKTINRQVGANQVGYNVSSPLTNFIPAVQAYAKINKSAFLKGFAQTVTNRMKNLKGLGDDFAENSSVMIRREGADRFSRTLWQKMADPGYALMGAVDSITTEIIARAKYIELTEKQGMSAEKAQFETDKWVSDLMGDRSLGQMPHLYNSKVMGAITKYQLEVRNQLDAMIYDTIEENKLKYADVENKRKRNAKIAARSAATFFSLAVAQNIFGKAFEAVAGYNPAFDIIEVISTAFGWDDDEESEDTVLDNIEEGFLALLEDLPYTSIIEGGRIPMSSAIPVKEIIYGKDEYGNEVERWKTVLEAIPYYLMPAGMNQIKKTRAGLKMFDNDLPVSGSYTDSGNLRFPVEKTPLNVAQAALFGHRASSNARDYFDGERKPLEEKQIQEFIDSGMTIGEYWDYRDGLSGLTKVQDKLDYISGLDITDEQKNLFAESVSTRKDAIDMTEYGKYGSLDEYDFATKYPDKYAYLEESGISYSEYDALDEESKNAYKWAFDNPDKRILVKAAGVDVVTFRKYQKQLGEIKSDKDGNGKTIKGSKDKKVIEHLNGIDAGYGTKLILLKTALPSNDSYNNDIVEYLNSSDDISYSDAVKILAELGATVRSDGSIIWN